MPPIPSSRVLTASRSGLRAITRTAPSSTSPVLKPPASACLFPFMTLLPLRHQPQHPTRFLPTHPAYQRHFHSSPSSQAVHIQPSQYEQIVSIAEDRVKEYRGISVELNDVTIPQAKQVKNAMRIKVLEPIYRAHEELVSIKAVMASSIPLLSDPDESLRELASEEVSSLQQELVALCSSTLPTLLLPPVSSAQLGCILELRAGMGGLEGALFTAELKDMYTRYCEKKGWQVSIISESMSSDAGNGTKSGNTYVSMEIKGDGAYGCLRWEGGVHCVIRVPATESKGRVHTSTTAVMVLPVAEEGDTENLSHVDEKEVKVEVMRAGGAGGQHVNTTESAVRLTHIPTGISVSMQDSRSQHQNKAKGWLVLRGRLYAHRLAIQQEERRLKRKSSDSGTNSGDKIRTYRFTSDRLTDHRIPATFTNIPTILSGEELQSVIDATQEHFLGHRLTRLLEGDDSED